MGNPLSLDLRERVVAVVDGGLSRRQAAARFSVSPASAVRWCQRKASGDLAPARQGGDRRSHRIEAHAEFILAEVAAAPARRHRLAEHHEPRQGQLASRIASSKRRPRQTSLGAHRGEHAWDRRLRASAADA